VHLWKHMDTCSIRYKGYREMCFVCCNIWIERAGQKEPLDTAPQGLIPWLFLVSGGGGGPPRWGGAADFAKVRQRDTCGLPAPMICE
jgi:hypothetical protein